MQTFETVEHPERLLSPEGDRRRSPSTASSTSSSPDSSLHASLFPSKNATATKEIEDDLTRIDDLEKEIRELRDQLEKRKKGAEAAAAAAAEVGEVEETTTVKPKKKRSKKEKREKEHARGEWMRSLITEWANWEWLIEWMMLAWLVVSCAAQFWNDIVIINEFCSSCSQDRCHYTHQGWYFLIDRIFVKRKSIV